MRGTQNPNRLEHQPQTLPFCLAHLAIIFLKSDKSRHSFLYIQVCFCLHLFSETPRQRHLMAGQRLCLTSPLMTMDFMQTQPRGSRKPFPTLSCEAPGISEGLGSTHRARSFHTHRKALTRCPADSRHQLPAEPQQALGAQEGSLGAVRWEEQAWSQVALGSGQPCRLPALRSSTNCFSLTSVSYLQETSGPSHRADYEPSAVHVLYFS